MNRKLILIVLLVFILSGLNAQIVTDRPDQTESSSTVPKGALQIESGILVGYEGENSFSTRQILLPTNLFRYGIANGIELRILNQVELLKFKNESFQGISDMELGLKIQLLKNENKNTEIAFLTHLVVPTGTVELTGDEFGTSNKLCISHTLNENLGLGYNLGYNYFGDGDGDLTYSLALGISLNDKFGMFVEPYGELRNMDEFISNIDAGITYLPRDHLQFDLSFGTGINHTMNYLSVGISYLIGNN